MEERQKHQEEEQVQLKKKLLKSEKLMNLVLNGVEEIALKDTGSPRAGHVTISTSNYYMDDLPSKGLDLPCGEYVMLCVSDNGSGIPGEYYKKIFDPFFTQKAMGRSGTGLDMGIAVKEELEK